MSDRRPTPRLPAPARRTRVLRRPLGGVAPWLLAAAALLLPGCASNTERWAEVSVYELGYQNLYHAILDLLEVEGFHVVRRDPREGTIESEWLLGISRREVRGQSRRRCHVDIEAKGEGEYVVRIRVEEQVVRKAGLLGNAARFDEDDWEPFPDNFDDAEYLVYKVRALLSEYIDKPVEVTNGSGSDGAG